MSMKLSVRIITSACIGYILYAILNFVLGNSGVAAMNELEQMKHELQLNIEIIEDNYETLSKELSGLRNSAERISIEARRIGYYRDNEGIIIIDGYEGRKKFYTLGKLVTVDDTENSRKALFRAVSLSTVLVSLIIVFIFTKRSHTS
jgi:cell division protein FtsB